MIALLLFACRGAASIESWEPPEAPDYAVDEPRWPVGDGGAQAALDLAMRAPTFDGVWSSASRGYNLGASCMFGSESGRGVGYSTRGACQPVTTWFDGSLYDSIGQTEVRTADYDWRTWRTSDGYAIGIVGSTVEDPWVPSYGDLEEHFAVRTHTGDELPEELFDARLGEYRVDLDGHRPGFGDTKLELHGGVSIASDPLDGNVGNFAIEADVRAFPPCGIEGDGDVVITGDRVAVVHFDGSTTCDGCGALTIDGAAAGEVCLNLVEY